MSPRQSVVIENSALKRFMKKHGYCIGAAWLAGLVEEELRVRREAEGDILCIARLRVVVKRRGDQWFVTDIERKVEEV